MKIITSKCGNNRFSKMALGAALGLPALLLAINSVVGTGSVNAADAAKGSSSEKAISGTAKDDAYAAVVWQYMAKNNFVGENRTRSYPFAGSRPHGSIQESIATEAVIDGHKGRLIVKQNYGGEGELTPRSVYQAGPNMNYEAVTIMFKREAGYAPDSADWFWAEYKPDGSVINYEGVNLSGRASLCIGCHQGLGGADLEILNGRN